LHHGDISIKGFTNHLQRRWVRYYRQIDKDANDAIWNGDDDVFDLRYLFKEQIYVPEKWD